MKSPRVCSHFVGRASFVLGVLLALSAVFRATAATAATPLSLERVTVALCSLPNHSVAAALEQAHALGFAGIEMAVFRDKETTYGETYPWVVVDELSPDEKTRLQTLVRRFKHVTTHLPYGPEMRPFAKDPAVREASRRELFRALDDSAFWGAKLANLHVLSEPGVSFATLKSELVAFYRELGAYAAGRGIRLAIETSRPYRMSEYLELIAAIDLPTVGGTIDTGHMTFYRPELGVEGAARQTEAGRKRHDELIAEFVTALGPKLFHVHIDDVRPVDWREHFLPGHGIIDWPRLMAQLAKADYRGLLVLEILYYDGAADTGPTHKEVFTRRTRPGAPEAGLREVRTFLTQTFAASAGK